MQDDNIPLSWWLGIVFVLCVVVFGFMECCRSTTQDAAREWARQHNGELSGDCQAADKYTYFCPVRLQNGERVNLIYRQGGTDIISVNHIP
jgi:hypothetical protein